MNYIDQTTIMVRAVMFSNQYGVYITNNLTYEDDDSDVWNYVLERVQDLDTRSALIHGGLFLFDDAVEAADFYRIFESGPVYASAIYAMLIDKTGEIITENT